MYHNNNGRLLHNDIGVGKNVTIICISSYSESHVELRVCHHCLEFRALLKCFVALESVDWDEGKNLWLAFEPKLLSVPCGLPTKTDEVDPCVVLVCWCVVIYHTNLNRLKLFTYAIRICIGILYSHQPRDRTKRSYTFRIGRLYCTLF